MNSALASVLGAMRPKQWMKNAVVLAPLIFALGDPAQKVGAREAWVALAAAAIFCLVSSGIYIFNDIRDADLDRLHPVKRLRPFASGALSIGLGRVLAPLLTGLGLLPAFALNRDFAWVLSGYVALQAAYTLALKRVALVDILVIAVGFVLRALGGAVAIQVSVSPWLLLCTLLLALFLALCKRRHELVALQGGDGRTRASLRAYDQGLLDILIPMIAAATLIAYSIYTLWPDTVAKFGSHKLGFTIPFVVYGLFRYLDLVYRHEKGGRPEQLLLTDLPLLLNVALYGVAVLSLLLWR
jgi:4-hydroxybenzoate polyprenyltransferase